MYCIFIVSVFFYSRLI